VKQFCFVAMALTLAAASLLLAGCGTVHFDAPQGQRVRLLTQDDPAAVRVERTIWYALWGNKVMNENHTAPFIATNQLVEVKMYTELSAADSLINPFTSILSFSRRTLVIEGNRRKEPTP
jgi:hypothetical protein